MTNQWPRNLCFVIAITLIVIDCHRLSSVVIDYHQFPYFLRGQKENAFREEIWWNEIYYIIVVLKNCRVRI